MRGSLCPGLLQRGVWEAVSGMREAKSVEILQVHEVEGWTTGGKKQRWRPQMLREMMGQVDACKQQGSTSRMRESTLYFYVVQLYVPEATV